MNLLGSWMCLGKSCSSGTSQASKELQVCMDFFACGNPFLVQACARDECGFESKESLVLAARNGRFDKRFRCSNGLQMSIHSDVSSRCARRSPNPSQRF